MKKLYPTLLFLVVITAGYAQNTGKDTLTRAQFVHLQTVKSDTLNMMALKLAVPGASKEDLDKAIDLIMKGIHTYSRFRDSVGMRETFDHLAFVYDLQKKYIQAKWFYIQSNSYAREMRDTANIINSLIALANVKAEMKNADLADSDLREAVSLARAQKGVDKQIQALQAVAAFYNKTGDSKQALLANKRITFINDSITKLGEGQKLAQDKQKPTNLNGQLTQKTIVQQKSTNWLLVFAVIIIVMLFAAGAYLKGKKRD